MFFTVSKFFEPLLNAGNLIALALIVALVFGAIRNRRAGAGIPLACATVLLLLLFAPVGGWSLAPLENRFPHPAWPNRADGALILGGGESRDGFAVHGTAAVLESEGRYVAAIELMRRYPNLRLLFSGDRNEADVARSAFAQLGADTSRIAFENRARNTWENLAYSKDMAQPRPGETWLVVAHASQIPRAMGIARRLNWPVVPWPVDYRTARAPEFSPQFSENLLGLDIAAHEWIGLFAYWASGRSASLFPAPENGTAAATGSGSGRSGGTPPLPDLSRN